LIVVDANILLYAHDSSSQWHQAAFKWWSSALASEALIGLPWVSISAFLRISTHHQAVQRPLRPEQAVTVVNSWLETGGVKVLDPGPRFWAILSHLLVSAQATGALVTDAQIAALALENSATVATHDKDFLRFEGLKTIYPLH